MGVWGRNVDCIVWVWDIWFGMIWVEAEMKTVGNDRAKQQHDSEECIGIIFICIRVGVQTQHSPIPTFIILYHFPLIRTQITRRDNSPCYSLSVPIKFYLQVFSVEQ